MRLTPATAIGASALAAALLGLGWWQLGAIGLLMATPLAAGLLALPLQQWLGDGAALTRRLARAHALRGTRDFRGQRVGVIVDDEGHWWLRVDDLHRLLDGLPDTARLLAATRGRSVPDSWRLPAHVRADALTERLEASNTHATRRFLAWLQAEQAADARRLRRAPLVRRMGPPGD